MVVKKKEYILILSFTLLTISSFILIPYTDSYYYWDWGKHLAWGYYDGPPLIALCMRIFRFIFHDHIFAINFFGVFSIAYTAWYVYRTALLLFTKNIALNATLLWLLSTPVLHYLFLWVTYDNLLNLFWAAIIYYTVRYIEEKNTRDLYFISVTTGLLLLSKYTGIILIVAIFFFLLLFERSLLRNKHFYGALLLLFIILTPHLFWSYTQQWVTFYYLFSQHTNYDGLHYKNILYFFIKIIKTYDVLFILPLYGFIKTRTHPPSVILLHIVSWTFLIFLFAMSFKNSISKHWLTPFTISSAILASYYFAKFHFQTIFRLTLSLYIIWGIYYLCVNVFLQRYFDEDFFAYHLIQKAGQQFKDNTIVTTDWETAAKLSFWLEGKRHIYTLPCGKENQYAKWREGFNKATNVLYLDLHPRFACVQKHFSNCVYLASFTKDGHRLGFNDHTPPLKLVAYRCHYKKDL